ncbi:MAG: serine/threonine protein kinase [Oscillospiraceae bacterium]|jgi:serine/threonine-protein kinase|nr:serine/threonine protein kinase [Oscillospiraceae bacterium]
MYGNQTKKSSHTLTSYSNEEPFIYGENYLPGLGYSIVGEIGSGSCGVVYKAWHKRLKKEIVIKELAGGVTNTIEVCRNEVEALKNIKNMHIPQVYDFIMDQDRSFTVMEYVEGSSLDKHLRGNKGFAKQVVCKWYYQLALALEALHKNNVCHRDIKPSNIILGNNGDVCLIDYNSARVYGNNTGVISRSIGYASPEQQKYFIMCAERRNDNNVNAVDWKLSDIYSLGASMYHALKGRRPPIVVDENIILFDENEANDSLEKIIECSMKINPKERYCTARELKIAISKVKL